MSYLLEGVPAIVWSNIVRGSQLSCPHIERSCTAATIEDRRLGFTERLVASACAVHFFTGNNIAPKGDLASRTLDIVLKVDRPDPENRHFQHDAPFEWTMRNRGTLCALYTILLGNPALRSGANTPPPKTRFKTWWRLIGSSIEHASSLIDKPIDFQDLFLQQEDHDVESTSLADALEALTVWMPNRKRAPKPIGLPPDAGDVFLAVELATCINDVSEANLYADQSAVLREFLFPELLHRRNDTVGAKSVGNQLRKRLDEPVRAGNRTLTLKSMPGRVAKDALKYFVLTAGGV